MTSKEITIALMLAVSGCGAGQIGMETGEGSFGETDGTELESQDIWAETRCLEVGSGTAVMFGRPHGSENTWTIVVNSEGLDMWPQADNAKWVQDGCASQTEPKSDWIYNFDCRDTTSGVFCYAGDEFYRAPIAPACDFSAEPVMEWPNEQCGYAVQIGANPWDEVQCTGVSGGSCYGVSGNVSMLVYPTCVIETFEPGAAC